MHNTPNVIDQLRDLRERDPRAALAAVVELATDEEDRLYLMHALELEEGYGPAADLSAATEQHRWFRNADKIWLYETDAPARLPGTIGNSQTDAEILYSARDECWLWCGAHQPDGRAVICEHGYGPVRMLRRVLWQHYRGDLDRWRIVVRTCESAAEECVNPWHAEQMTRGEAATYRHKKEAATR